MLQFFFFLTQWYLRPLASRVGGVVHWTCLHVLGRFHFELHLSKLSLCFYLLCACSKDLPLLVFTLQVALHGLFMLSFISSSCIFLPQRSD